METFEAPEISNNCLKNVICLFCCILVGIGCAEKSPDPKRVNSLSDLRERWMTVGNGRLTADYYGAHPNRIAREFPEMKRILDDYIEAVFLQPRRENQIHFVVTDESGRRLSVEVEVRGIYFDSPFDFEPEVIRHIMHVEGETTIPWPHRSVAVEIALSKNGYRSISTAFAANLGDATRRYEYAEEMLERGFVLPPEKDRLPIRIVIPQSVIWDPDDPNVSSSDSSLQLDRSYGRRPFQQHARRF